MENRIESHSADGIRRKDRDLKIAERNRKHAGRQSGYAVAETKAAKIASPRGSGELECGESQLVKSF